MNVDGWIHVNVNCSDFDRSKAFYERLGFREVAVAIESNDSGVAAAMGLERYRFRASLFALEGGAPGTPLLDLIEWREPATSGEPYPHLHHAGLARIALRTGDFDADLAELRAAGVEFVSDEPATLVWPGMPTSRLICFKDPDGTVIELVELQPS